MAPCGVKPMPDSPSGGLIHNGGSPGWLGKGKKQQVQRSCSTEQVC
jgi:hypothetical protein